MSNKKRAEEISEELLLRMERFAVETGRNLDNQDVFLGLLLAFIGELVVRVEVTEKELADLKKRISN